MTGNTAIPAASPRIAVVIPAFNESTVLAAVIADVRAHCSYPIIIVDDASTDDTRAIAEQAGTTVIPLAVQLGAWGATQAGLRYALRLGFDLVITMDADGQHTARSLAALIAPVITGQADVAIGACTERGSRSRKAAWVLMKIVSGLTMSDLTSGLRAYNRRALRHLASWRATLLEYQDIGILLLLKSHELSIIDVPVSMDTRHNGKSRIFRSWLLVVHYMMQTLLLGLSKRRPLWR